MTSLYGGDEFFPVSMEILTNDREDIQIISCSIDTDDIQKW